MAGTEWQSLASVSDGQVVDFEVLNSLINNSNYLKEHATSIQYTTGDRNTGTMYNEGNTSYRIKLVGGIVNFKVGRNGYHDIPITYKSKTAPIVLVSVHNNAHAHAYTYNVTKSGAQCRVIKDSGNDTTGSVYWLALTTIES